MNNSIGPILPGRKPSVPSPAAKAKESTHPASPADPVDSVVGSEPVEKKSKSARKLRKAFLSVASTGLALAAGATSVPSGIQIGLDSRAGRAEETTRLNAARVSTLTAVATSSAVGMAVLGPVGLVVGGVVGYISGIVGNHLEARSGIGDQKLDKIGKAVVEKTQDSNKVWGTVKAVAVGAVAGAKEGFKNRKMTSKIQLSGMLDGVSEAIQDFREPTAGRAATKTQDKEPHSLLGEAALRASGVLLGTAGVMINAPGGLIIGVLESLKETTSYIPSQMTKNIMLWATNVGKFLPAAAVGAFIGGPVGLAASTAVGVATASVTSIIDGRLGVNQRIAEPVKRAVQDAQGGDEGKDNLRAYYRAGKGSVVGLAAGVREGWKAGYQGGTEMMGDIFAATPQSIEKKES